MFSSQLLELELLQFSLPVTRVGLKKKKKNQHNLLSVSFCSGGELPVRKPPAPVQETLRRWLTERGRVLLSPLLLPSSSTRPLQQPCPGSHRLPLQLRHGTASGVHVCRLRAQTGWTQLYILVIHLPASLRHDPHGTLPTLHPSSPLQLQPSGLSTQRHSPPELSSSGRTHRPRPLPQPELRTSVPELPKHSQQAAQPSSQRVSSLHAQPVSSSLPHARDTHTHQVWRPRVERRLLTEPEDINLTDWFSGQRFLVSISVTLLFCSSDRCCGLNVMLPL